MQVSPTGDSHSPQASSLLSQLTTDDGLASFFTEKIEFIRKTSYPSFLPLKSQHPSSCLCLVSALLFWLCPSPTLSDFSPSSLPSFPSACSPLVVNMFHYQSLQRKAFLLPTSLSALLSLSSVQKQASMNCLHSSSLSGHSFTCCHLFIPKKEYSKETSDLIVANPVCTSHSALAVVLCCT